MAWPNRLHVLLIILLGMIVVGDFSLLAILIEVGLLGLLAVRVWLWDQRRCRPTTC